MLEIKGAHFPLDKGPVACGIHVVPAGRCTFDAKERSSVSIMRHCSLSVITNY